MKLKKGSKDDPHLIHLLALDSDKPIEEMFSDFITNETDNLNPERLDFLLLKNNRKKIEFNKIYNKNN